MDDLHVGLGLRELSSPSDWHSKTYPLCYGPAPASVPAAGHGHLRLRTADVRSQPEGHTYYACQPRANNRGRPDTYAGHPKSIDIREDTVLDAVAQVLARRVFGPQRRELLAADIAGADDRAVIERDHHRERLQRKIADLARRQNTIMRQAQTLEPDDPYGQGLRETYNELHAEKQASLAAVAEIDAADAAEPTRPSPADAALLDALPYLTMNRPPEWLLRRLYEIVQLTVQIHPTTREATVTVPCPPTSCTTSPPLPPPSTPRPRPASTPNAAPTPTRLLSQM